MQVSAGATRSLWRHLRHALPVQQNPLRRCSPCRSHLDIGLHFIVPAHDLRRSCTANSQARRRIGGESAANADSPTAQHHAADRVEAAEVQQYRRISEVGALLLAACALSISLPIPAALAAAGDVVTYDNSVGSEGLRSVFGVGYALLVGFFAIRLLTKRAGKAKSESVRGVRQEGSELPPPPRATTAGEEARATPLGAIYGAAQAAFLFALLWTLTTNLSAFFDSRPVPSNYTARNIGVTVKTVVEGLAYLLTFIFGANAVGLTALAFQLALFPGSDGDAKAVPKAADPGALPKIMVTDDLYSIRKAFEEAQRSGSKQNSSGSDKT